MDSSEATLAALMGRGALFSEACPSRDVMRHVTSRWGVLILVALLGGTYRFADLRRKVNGVSEKMLAQTLQLLEGDGLLLRIAYPVLPPHVEYSLTPLGEELAAKVEAATTDAERSSVIVDAAVDLCERLVAGGAPGLHFYTLNNADAPLAIWQNLAR